MGSVGTDVFRSNVFDVNKRTLWALLTAFAVCLMAGRFAALLTLGPDQGGSLRYSEAQPYLVSRHILCQWMKL